MRVLVTGAQGFIGRYVVADWLEHVEDVEVVGLGRSPRQDVHFTHQVTWRSESLPSPLGADLAARFAEERYTYVQADLTDTPSLTKLIGEVRPDVIVHLAASLRDEPPEQLVRANVGAVVSLIDAVVGAGIDPPKLVMGSSGSVYGVVEGRALPLVEHMECAPIDPYSVSKRAAEDMARILAAEYELDMVWARIFNPVGAGQDERHLCGRLGQQVASIMCGHSSPQLSVGPLHTTRDYIDVRDTASALRILATAGERGVVYNVATGLERSGSQVLDTLASSAGLDLELSIRAMPGRRADMERHVADVTRLSDLGWAPRHDLADSLRAVLDHYAVVVAAVAEGIDDRDGPDRRPLLELRADRPHQYTVEIGAGLLEDVPSRLAARFGGASMVVLTDDGVQARYAEPLVAGLRAAGCDTSLVVVPDGESHKSLAQFERVIGELHARRFERRSVLVNVGGGMITDLGGYVAASYLRGVAYVNVPTTLLAQHDSAVGGKVAVNTTWAKNAIGAFHHPHAVYCDPAVLTTLDDRDIRCGVAESIKVALCGAPGLFEMLELQAERVLAKDPTALELVIRRSVAHKIALLAPDPHEIDLRRVLNLGHTYGHALETELAYDEVRHGEAVGYGIGVATLVAHERGRCSTADAERILGLLDRYDILPPVDPARLLRAAGRIDEIRLVRGGVLNYVIPTSLRSVEILRELSTSELCRAVTMLSERRAGAAAAR